MFHDGQRQLQERFDTTRLAELCVSKLVRDVINEKQKAFIESITSGNLVNEAQSGVDSALACMLGREAAATGKEVTWEKLLKSKTVFEPKIDWKPFV